MKKDIKYSLLRTIAVVVVLAGAVGSWKIQQDWTHQTGIIEAKFVWRRWVKAPGFSIL